MSFPTPSNPGWSTGYQPPATEWNSTFGGKLDALILTGQTAGATSARLTTDGEGAGSANVLNLADNSACALDIRIVGYVTAGTPGAASFALGAVLYFRGAGAASTTVVPAGPVPSVNVSGSTAGMSATISADTVNGGLNVTVEGVAGQTILWTAVVIAT